MFRFFRQIRQNHLPAGKVWKLLGCLLVLTAIVFLGSQFSPRRGDTGEGRAEKEYVAQTGVGLAESEERRSQGADQADVGSPIAHDVRDWGEAVTLMESVVPVSGNPYLSIRRRIVRDAGFARPVLLEENLIRDPATGEELVELGRSMLANQLVISGSQPLDQGSIETVLEGSEWDLGAIIGSGHTAVVESGELELDTVEKGIQDLRERFAAIEELQVEPNIIFYASVTAPNDELFEEPGLWGLNNTGDHDIDAPEGWDLLRDASEVTVAITDSGIRLDHEDLVPNLWRNPDEIPDNNIDDDNNGYVDDVFGLNTIDPSIPPDDDGGHGTHVAGIVGAVGDNEMGVVGVAWVAELMAVKFLNASGRGALDDAVEAIDYAVANGAKIVNASWGGLGRPLSLERAMERAGDSGVFIVAAAGNESDNIDDVYRYPSSSDLPNVITVASIDQSGDLSRFSNYGIGSTDLAAPGSDILSTWADSADAYSVNSGTSMAAPYVSGILALNVALRPENDMRLHIDRLIFTSKKRSQLSNAARSQGVVSLAASLALDNIPFPPIIDGHSDLNLFKAVGETVEMSVDVFSDLPVVYEWHFNDAVLAGQDTSTLTLESITEADEGVYTFTATNDDGEASVEFELVALTHSPSLAEGLDAGPGVTVLPERDDQWSIGFDSESRGGDHIEGFYPTDGQDNNLRAVVQGPGLLRFFWKLEGVPESVSRPECRVGEHTVTLYEAPGEWDLATVLLEDDKAYDMIWRFYDTTRSDVEGGRLLIDHLQVHPQGEEPPLIFKHPEDLSVRPFDDINLSAFASGANLVYDWYRDGESMGVDADRHLSIGNVTIEDEGAYHVVVSNAFGSDTSRSAMVDVDEDQTPAHFVELSADFKGVEGERLDITLPHGGSPRMQYRWYRDQYQLPGETGPTLSFNPLRMEHAGLYQMVIENPFGSAQWSNHMWIQVVDRDLSPAAVLGERDPHTIEANEGSAIENDYWIATEFLPLDFQWFRNGVPVEGQTNRELLIESATYEDSGTYFLEFKNDRGSFRGADLFIVVQFDAGDALDYSDVDWEMNGQEDRGWKYTQREVSYDGEDAIEFARRYEFDGPTRWDDGGFAEFVGAYFTGPLNLSAYWKRTSDQSWFEAHVGDYPRIRGGEFPSASRVATFVESGEVGEWQKSVIHVPAGEHFVAYRFVGADPEEKGWLDKIEVTDAPAMVGENPGRILVGADGITVSAQASGSGTIAYQWFKNGVLMEGESSPALFVAADAFSPTDRFYASATSEFGETFSGAFQLKSIEDIIDTRNQTFTFGGDSYWEENLSDPSRMNALKITLKPEESAWMEFDVLGPAVVSYDGHGVFPFLDGSLTSAIEWIGLYGLRREYLNVPAGLHTVRLSYGAQPGDSAPRTNYISDIAITDAPYIISEDPFAINGTAEYRLETAVYFSGDYPLTVKWYKNGELAKEATENSSSYSRFFDDVEAPKIPEDAGTYFCEVTDSNGATRRSEDFVVREVDTKEIGEVVGDEGLYLCDGYFPISYDTETYFEGGSSARFTIPEAWIEGFVKLCGPDEPQDSYPPIQLSVRISGYDDETIVEVRNGGDSQLLDLTENWQTVELAGNSNIVGIYADKSLGSELTVWFDGAERDYGLGITDHPQHFSTYLNGGASFSVGAFSGAPISYQWRRDGEDIPGATSETLEFEKVGLSDLGQYDVVVSSGGESAVSKPAMLGVSDDLGAAIEYPGLRIRTWGDALWEIDEIVSIDGTSSLKSGDIDPGESSHIEIEFDFPGMYSVYQNVEYSDGEKRRWEIRNDISPDLPFKIDIFVSLENGEASGNNYTKNIRLDRLSFSALASRSYDEWLDGAVFPASDPNLRDSLIDESADTDGDRISNFLEYLFDLDPLTPSRLPNLNFRIVDGQILAGVAYRFAANGESTVRFEVSDDLQNWELLYPDSVQTLGEDSSYYDISSTALVPLSENGRTFVRWTTSRTEEGAAPIEITSQGISGKD